MPHLLDTKLTRAYRRFRRLAWIAAGSRWATVLLLTGLFFILADWAVGSESVGLRLAFAIGWWIVGLGGFGHLAVLLWRSRMSRVDFARLMAVHFPDLGDSLPSAIEFLEHPEEDSKRGSNSLRAEVIRRVSEKAEPLDFQKTIDPRPAIRALPGLFLVVLVIIGLALWQPNTFLIGVERLFLPAGEFYWPVVDRQNDAGSLSPDENGFLNESDDIKVDDYLTLHKIRWVQIEADQERLVRETEDRADKILGQPIDRLSQSDRDRLGRLQADQDSIAGQVQKSLKLLQTTIEDDANQKDGLLGLVLTTAQKLNISAAMHKAAESIRLNHLGEAIAVEKTVLASLRSIIGFFDPDSTRGELDESLARPKLSTDLEQQKALYDELAKLIGRQMETGHWTRSGRIGLRDLVRRQRELLGLGDQSKLVDPDTVSELASIVLIREQQAALNRKTLHWKRRFGDTDRLPEEARRESLALAREQAVIRQLVLELQSQ
jgi:hypothetical protein